MRCESVRNKLDRLRRQELATPMRERVEAHLHECADCRQQRARQERLVGLLVVEHLTYEKALLTAQQQQQLFELLRSRSGSNRGGALLVPGGGHEGGIGQVLRTGGEQ